MAETPAVDDVAEVEEGADAPDSDGAGGDAEGGKQGKTWYPYITKNQFEKFLSRLHGKVPNEIDRDYVRAIIRTPSMIYRFLRGIEAMKLIDRDQKPTDRLHRLVDTETRSDAMREIVRDLYGDMLDEREGESDDMPDGEITAFFRQRTGMGNDSANKMKMFFKYLMAEANLSDEETAPEPAAAAPDPEPAPAPAPAPAAQSRRASRDRGGESRQGSRSSSAAADSQGERSSGGNSRPLSETQKAYLETVQKIVRIKIDGDWDDDMIRLAFDRLERLFDRVKRG